MESTQVIINGVDIKVYQTTLLSGFTPKVIVQSHYKGISEINNCAYYTHQRIISIVSEHTTAIFRIKKK